MAPPSHDHSHHAQDQHVHAHPDQPVPTLGAARSQPVAPALSLLQLSVPQRLAVAALLSALIWAGVWWALHP
jgi:hypothetical protein